MYHFPMHEWALAESVIKAAAQHAAELKLKRVSEVAVVFGELQAIDKEIFPFAMKELAKKHPLMASARFRVIDEPAAFRCRACSAEFDLKRFRKESDEAEFIHFVPEMAHSFIKCPSCKSPDFEMTAGRGVYIKHIKGSK